MLRPALNFKLLQLRSCQQIKRFRATRGLQRDAGKLDGRIAVAIGCTEGIGFAMARRLAKDGAHVILSSRNQAKVDEAVNKLSSMELKVSGFPCNAGRAEDRKNLLAHAGKTHGGFDILLNNAGENAHYGPILETPDSAIDKALEVNVKANFCLVRDAVPFMTGRKHGGSIVLTSSVSGYQTQEYPGAYAVSKSAIFSLIKAFLPSLWENNIRINCIALGLFDTAFSDVVSRNESYKQSIITKLIPMGRFGKPKETEGMISFLCSDDASYVTGETFAISGGAFTRL